MTEQQLLLLSLSEECAEVSHRVSKALRFTLEEVQPGQSLTNAEQIEQEFTDLVAVMEMLHDLGVIPYNTLRFENGKHDKKQKIYKYLQHSREVGVLKP